jgi:hypothetical protein
MKESLNLQTPDKLRKSNDQPSLDQTDTPSETTFPNESGSAALQISSSALIQRSELFAPSHGLHRFGRGYRYIMLHDGRASLCCNMYVQACHLFRGSSKQHDDVVILSFAWEGTGDGRSDAISTQICFSLAVDRS